MLIGIRYTKKGPSDPSTKLLKKNPSTKFLNKKKVPSKDIKGHFKFQKVILLEKETVLFKVEILVIPRLKYIINTPLTLIIQRAVDGFLSISHKQL